MSPGVAESHAGEERIGTVAREGIFNMRDWAALCRKI